MRPSVHGSRVIPAHPPCHHRRVPAHLFYTYYAKNGVTDKSAAVWFSFGGPGAATIWLHMGAFGPKMVKMQPNGWRRLRRIPTSTIPTAWTPAIWFHRRHGPGFSQDKPGYGPDFGGGERSGRIRRVIWLLNEYNLWGSPLFIAAKATAPRAPLVWPAPDGPRHSDQRRDAALGGNRFQRRGGRTAPTQRPAHRDHDRAFPQKLAPDLQKLTVEQVQTGTRICIQRAWSICSAAPRQAQRKGAIQYGAYTGLSNHSSIPWTCVSVESVQHGIAARPAPDDVAPGFAFCRLPNWCGRQQYELRLQQFQ